MKNLLTFIKGDSTACGHGFARNERGGTLAELAILIPFLIIMLAAVTELGRLFQTYTTLSKSTRAAARYLSNQAYDTTHINQAKNIAVCGKTNCTGTDPVAKGLTDANVVVAPDAAFAAGGGGGNPTSVTISITNYNFQPLFNLGALLQADSFTNLPIGSSTTMYYMWIDPAGVEE
jgi:Flp pilus assembly protein TadG